MGQAAQWGWLHAVPEGQKRNRQSLYGEARGIDWDAPGHYLLQALWDVGPSRFEGGAELPITWAELAAYASVSDVRFEMWELRAVMDMSKAYVAERIAGSDPFRIAPAERDNG